LNHLQKKQYEFSQLWVYCIKTIVDPDNNSIGGRRNVDRPVITYFMNIYHYWCSQKLERFQHINWAIAQSAALIKF